MDVSDLKSALVHHWFIVPSGGEQVCEALCRILDRPDFFTLVSDSKQLTPLLKQCRQTVSFLQRLPNSRRWYRLYALLYPLAVEQFDLNPYDLVVSSDSSVVKGVITQPETCHVCYCHTPVRWAWNMYQEYRGKGLYRLLFAPGMHYLRMYDYAASQRVDYFAANSMNVKRRIWKYYRRSAAVIHPPVDVERYSISSQPDDYYLFVGRLVGYKRADLAVAAFTENGRKLVVAGSGPQEKRLKAMAGKNVEFVGWRSNEELAGLYSRCRALIFPADEDFGMVPVEVQAAGRPVVALGRGGALETVIHDKTGVFFDRPEVDAINAAVLYLEKRIDRFEPEHIRANAMRFSQERFLGEMNEYLKNCVLDHKERLTQ
jgi:glycosyltransferase involved in cell wall biosynthesis